MNYSEFKRIISTFADTPADIDLAKNRLIIQVRDEIIEAELHQREGDIIVRENGIDNSSYRWITQRLAKLDLLADRIRTLIPDNLRFVTPSGFVLNHVDGIAAEAEEPASDALSACVTMLDPTHAGFTNITYLTSHAGEGKSTLISEIAHRQSAAFKAKQTNWLLIPIVLGGRSFLRFDDVIIGALVEKLRFPYIFYDSFLELVKMGVIVPAFDGFEEMFVESSSGEAISAVGNLINALSSSGSVLISARRAFFDYMGLKSQARLFDSLKGNNVVFSKISLNTWTRDQFILYAEKCGFEDGSGLYDDIKNILGDDHPLLSRAVLVKNLLELSKIEGDRQALLSRLQGSPDDYFYGFVDTIVAREASEKWIDRSGQPYKPLITHEEHHLLLSEIAHEMWISGSDVIKGEVLEVIAETFCEDRRLALHVRRQAVERIKQYPLLHSPDSRGILFGFDHEELKNFFLGEYVGRLIFKQDEVGLRSLLKKAILPAQSVLAGVALVRRSKAELPQILTFIQKTINGEGVISYSRESLGSVAVALLDGQDGGQFTVNGLTIGTDLLIATSIKNINFANCYFQSQNLDRTSLDKIHFNSTRFERLTVHDSTVLRDVVMQESEVDSIYLNEADVGIFNPPDITQRLRQLGIKMIQQIIIEDGILEPQTHSDEDLKLSQRLLRYFLRSTYMPDSIIKLKLGQRANYFIDVVLPQLLSAGILVEAAYTGAGNHTGYKLGVQMTEVVRAITESKGRFDLFVKILSNP